MKQYKIVTGVRSKGPKNNTYKDLYIPTKLNT